MGAPTPWYQTGFDRQPHVRAPEALLPLAPALKGAVGLPDGALPGRGGGRDAVQTRRRGADQGGQLLHRLGVGERAWGFLALGVFSRARATKILNTRPGPSLETQILLVLALEGTRNTSLNRAR